MIKERFDAEVDELARVIDLVNQTLENSGWDDMLLPVVDVAVEEIFVNIASYAYQTLPDAEKFADISIETDDEGTATIVFEDAGIEYNPLLKEDPDVTLSAQERQIGGLGIYMVKKSMDHVSYARVDGKNVFTIVKKKQSAV